METRHERERGGSTKQSKPVAWEKMLGLLLYLAGLGIDVAGTAISVDVPVHLQRVAVIVGLLILFWMTDLNRLFVGALAAVAVVVWIIAALNQPGDHTLFTNFANLREEPSLDGPRILRLQDREGEKIHVDQDGERNGWFWIETDRGEEGWLFGAFIRGLDDYNVGVTKNERPAVLLDEGGRPTGEVNPSTSRVLIVERTGDFFEILTAGGETRWVEADAVFDFS